MKKLKGAYNTRREKEWSTQGLHEKIISLIPLAKKNKRALDVGCGSGNLMFKLSNKGYLVEGIDIENFVDDKRFKVKESDLDNNWPFEKDSFDLIVATEIIEHLENPRHFMRELKRILKEGGMAVISTPNLLNWKARIYYLIKGIIWGFREEDYVISGHITPLLIYDFKRICKEEDLSINRITYNKKGMLFGDNLILIIKKRDSK